MDLCIDIEDGYPSPPHQFIESSIDLQSSPSSPPPVVFQIPPVVLQTPTVELQNVPKTLTLVSDGDIYSATEPEADLPSVNPASLSHFYVLSPMADVNLYQQQSSLDHQGNSIALVSSLNTIFQLASDKGEIRKEDGQQTTAISDMHTSQPLSFVVQMEQLNHRGYHVSMAAQTEQLNHSGYHVSMAAQTERSPHYKRDATEQTSPGSNVFTEPTCVSNDLIAMDDGSTAIEMSDSDYPYLHVALVDKEEEEEPHSIISTTGIMDCASQTVVRTLHACAWKDCTENFPDRDSLITHVHDGHVMTACGKRTDDDDYRLSFVCEWRGCCRQGLPFDARYKLVVHVRTHTFDRPHTCPLQNCGRSFTRAENMKIHLRSHTGERPYLCNVAGCNKSFANSSDRVKHKRTQHEKRPFYCRVANCGRSYTDPSSLRKHKKAHEDGRVEAKILKRAAALKRNAHAVNGFIAAPSNS